MHSDNHARVSVDSCCNPGAPERYFAVGIKHDNVKQRMVDFYLLQGPGCLRSAANRSALPVELQVSFLSFDNQVLIEGFKEPVNGSQTRLFQFAAWLEKPFFAALGVEPVHARKSQLVECRSCDPIGNQPLFVDGFEKDIYDFRVKPTPSVSAQVIARCKASDVAEVR